jgi:hypothetical protein
MKQRRRIDPSSHPIIRSGAREVPTQRAGTQRSWVGPRSGWIGHHPCFLEGTVADRAGNLYITDRAQSQVLQVTPEGIVVTLVGPGDLSVPTALALSSDGSLYISDSSRHRVVKLGRER